ncbi:MarR family transcriptional regulator [Clostridium sp. YIM B02506]|uniref:MarR family winged helix-turn-helix transcriptional regulator n=1 Tax=Clostridium sp. YIM B02506 TaxID=2910680 RepID=UPI001EEE4776|nr:MarR family transcriptional regulator [Clostridium sp. YIM B02506]
MSSRKETNLIGNLIHAVDKLAIIKHNDNLKVYDVTFTQAVIMEYIYSHEEGSVNQKTLEVALGLTNPSVTSLIKTMMSKNLIYRIKDAQDGRYYKLYLTPKGQELCIPCTKTIVEVDKSYTKNFTLEEREQLFTLLNKMLENL